MKYVEFCKLCLSRPGKLKTKFDLNVLCIFSYVALLVLDLGFNPENIPRDSF